MRDFDCLSNVLVDLYLALHLKEVTAIDESTLKVEWYSYYNFPNSDAIYVYVNDTTHSLSQRVDIGQNFTLLRDLSVFASYNVCAIVCEKSSSYLNITGSIILSEI